MRDLKDVKTEDITDEELVNICGVDNGWAADELGVRLRRANYDLDQCKNWLVLANVKKSGWFRRFFWGEWATSDRELREMAQITLDTIQPESRKKKLELVKHWTDYGFYTLKLPLKRVR